MSPSYLDYALRGRNQPWRVLIAVPLAVLLAIALGVAILVPLQLSGFAGQDIADGLVATERPARFFLSNGVLFLILLIGFALAARWIHGKRFGDILGAWRWRVFALGVGVWLIALIGGVLLDYTLAPAGFRWTAGPETLAVAGAALLGLGVQTFAEEFVFRGYLTQVLLANLRRPIPTAILSGLVFGAVHIPNGAPHAASATVTGIAMSLIAIRTGSLAFTSGMHMINNVFAAVVVVSAGDAFRGSPGLFTQDTPHLMWFDAGVGVTATLILTALIYRYWKPVSGR